MILNKNKKIILISVIIIIILLIICYFFINNNSNKNNNNSNNIKEHFIESAIGKVSIIGGSGNPAASPGSTVGLYGYPISYNLLVSSDGLDWRPASMNWTSNASPTGGQITIPEIKNNNLFDNCFSGASGLDETGRALFVIVGNGNNSIAYSYDGVTWVGLGNTIFNNGGFYGGGGRGIAWNGSMWVAVGGGDQISSNAVAYSLDGKNWVGLRNNSFSLKNPTADRLFYNWSPYENPQTSSPPDGNMFTGSGGSGNCIVSIGRQWIAGGYGGASSIWVSNDGKIWTPNSSKVDISVGNTDNDKTPYLLPPGIKIYREIEKPFLKVNNMASNDTMIVLVGGNNGGGNSILYSKFSDFIYKDNIFIGINFKTINSFYSYNNSIPKPTNINTILCHTYNCITYANNMWVAGGIGECFTTDNTTPMIIYSYDGINWYRCINLDVPENVDPLLINNYSLFNGSCNGVSWNGSLWIATGYGKGKNTIATSSDGISWSKVLNSQNLINIGMFAISGINASLIKLPTTTQPTTTQPTTTQPTTTQPTTTRPTTTQPTTTRPTTTQPTTTQPTTTRPTTTQPTTTQPTTTQPTTTRPTTTFASTTLDTIISETTTTRPTTTQSTTTYPTTTQPTTTYPTTTYPTTTYPTTTYPTTTYPTTTYPTTTQPTTTQPTTTYPTTTQPTTTQPPINILSSVGPCSRIEIISNNMNFAGLLILNQYGNNIFNNNYITSKLTDISGNIMSTSLTPINSSASVSTIANTNPMSISNAFAQTYNMILNNIDSCNFDIDTTNTPNATNLNNNYNICNKPNYIINPNDSSKIFTTSSGTNTNLSINIPQITNTNIPLPTNMQINNISKIIFCMIKNINNDDMINSLKINIYDLNNKPIAEWNDIRTIISTNFLTLALPPLISNTIPNSTQTNVARFVDIKKSYFSDVFANKVSYSNYYPASVNTSFTTMPNSSTSYSTMGNSVSSTPYSTMGNSLSSSTMPYSTSYTNVVKGSFPELQSITSFMNDIKSMFPDISQNQIKDLIDSGIDINKLKANNEIINNNESIDDNGNVLNSKGIHLSNNFKGPSTNIMQVDFTGTSNIYSPYLYYNKATTEKFNSVK